MDDYATVSRPADLVINRICAIACAITCRRIIQQTNREHPIPSLAGGDGPTASSIQSTHPRLAWRWCCIMMTNQREQQTHNWGTKRSLVPANPQSLFIGDRGKNTKTQNKSPHLLLCYGIFYWHRGWAGHCWLVLSVRFVFAHRLFTAVIMKRTHNCDVTVGLQ